MTPSLDHRRSTFTTLPHAPLQLFQLDLNPLPTGLDEFFILLIDRRLFDTRQWGQDRIDRRILKLVISRGDFVGSDGRGIGRGRRRRRALGIIHDGQAGLMNCA